jgi:hypothetical protein
MQLALHVRIQLGTLLVAQQLLAADEAHAQELIQSSP